SGGQRFSNITVCHLIDCSRNPMTAMRYKTEEDIQQLRVGADILSRLLGEIAGLVQPGITTLSLDKFAHEYIHDHGCTPSFLGYQGFPYSLCISVNDEIV